METYHASLGHQLEFWPVNGIFPSEELAERQIRIAKELGLNMLNFHRFIGNTDVMNYADELGLLYFEEPGGFRLDVKQPFMNAVLHEKVIRMVKRDRSHPCLVIYNMMNESGNATPEKLELEIQAMKDMRVLDPSRLILRTSAWAKGDDIEDQAKIHIRPYDEKCIGVVGMIIIVPEDLLFGMKVCTKALKIIIMIQRISVKLYSLVRKGLYHHLLVWKK